MQARAESEITVKVLCSKKKLFDILERKHFLLKRRLKITDYYFTHLDILNANFEFKTLIKNSLIIRHKEIIDKSDLSTFGIDGQSTLLYKKKEFAEDNTVLSELKIACDLGNPTKAKRIFSAMGLNNWCVKKGTWHIYKRKELELYVQEVENLGLFIELEQSENQKGSPQKIQQALIQEIESLRIPLGNDFNVNIAHLLYLKRYTKPVKRLKPIKTKLKPASKPKPAVKVKAKAKRKTK